MHERVEDLTRDIFGNLRRIGSMMAGRTKRQTEAAVEEAAPAGGLLGLGVLVAGIGTVLLLTTPVVPPRQRRIRRRMLTISTLYVVVGGTAAALGATVARDVVRSRARHAAHNLQRDTDAVQREVERQMR